MNDYGQIAIGDDLGDQVPFFPEFRNLEIFGKNLPVKSIGLGAWSTHILTESGQLFACGSSDLGQLGNGSSL
jgi:alpha-tubulin suppressor-like RCC1 family protein